MASLNKVLLIGNLTRDPELKYTANGSAVCSMQLAINNKYKSNNEVKEDTCFVGAVVWGKQAENCNEYLKKGNPVFIEGRLQYKTWEGKDGQQKNKLEVVVSSVQFLSNNSKTGNQQDNSKKSNDDSVGNEEDTPF